MKRKAPVDATGHGRDAKTRNGCTAAATEHSTDAGANSTSTAVATEHSVIKQLRPSVYGLAIQEFNARRHFSPDAPWPAVSERNALEQSARNVAREGTWSHFVEAFQRSFTVLLVKGTEEPWKAACLALYTKVYSNAPDRAHDLIGLLASLCEAVRRRWSWRSILDDILQDRVGWLQLRTPGDKGALLNFIEGRSEANQETIKSIKAELRALRGAA